MAVRIFAPYLQITFPNRYGQDQFGGIQPAVSRILCVQHSVAACNLPGFVRRLCISVLSEIGIAIPIYADLADSSFVIGRDVMGRTLFAGIIKYIRKLLSVQEVI